MATRKHRKAHYVQQTEKMIPFITSEIAFVSMSANWFLVSTKMIWILGSKLILSNNQSSATLWVRDTCLIVGLRPLIIIMITASLSSKNVKQSAKVRKFCVRGIVIHIEQFKIISVGGASSFWCWCIYDWSLSRNKSPCTGWFEEECNTSVTISQRSRAGIPSMCKPASKETHSDSVVLLDTGIGFLHIDLMGTNVRLPKTH